MKDKILRENNIFIRIVIQRQFSLTCKAILEKLTRECKGNVLNPEIEIVLFINLKISSLLNTYIKNRLLFNKMSLLLKI